MGYEGIRLQEMFKIRELYSIHYFEYMSDFSFEGESHDFWEFVCVDKGEVGIVHDDSLSILRRGDVAFHKPNEFHSVKGTREIAPNIVVVSFKCTNKHMDFFKDKILRIDEAERDLLAKIIIEARVAFSSRLDDPYLTHMTKSTADSFGSEQLIKLYIEQFLIHIFRRYANPIPLTKKLSKAPPKTTKSRSDSEIFNRVVDYLEANLNRHITIEDICRENIIGRSQLQKIFREKSSSGIIEYFSAMKISAAKQMIRTGHMNFTQISEQLGYASIHYFSRQFKKVTGMTPSEYASSIKAMAEGSFE